MSEARLTNIAAHLPEMARRLPDTPAIHVPQRRDGQLFYRHATFAELEEKSNRIAHALEAFGIGRGVRTVLMVPPGLEFFALTFALFKVGAVPVLVDPGMGLKNLRTCLQEAAPEAFIGIPRAHIARLLFGWGKGHLRRLLTVGRRFPWGGKTLEEIVAAVPPGQPYVLAPTDEQEPAAILFTSGSTGVPKGALYSHGNFASQVEMLRDLYGIRPGEIRPANLPSLCPVRPGAGNDGGYSGDGFYPAGIGRSGKADRRHAEVSGEQHVRFASPDQPGRALRTGKRITPAEPAPGHFRRRSGAGQGPGAFLHPAFPRSGNFHPLRRHRGVAGVLHRQPGNPWRNPSPHRQGGGDLRRPTGTGNPRGNHRHQR